MLFRNKHQVILKIKLSSLQPQYLQDGADFLFIVFQTK